MHPQLEHDLQERKMTQRGLASTGRKQRSTCGMFRDERGHVEIVCPSNTRIERGEMDAAEEVAAALYARAQLAAL